MHSLRELLHENDLGHLDSALRAETLRSLYDILHDDSAGGRIALLSHLRVVGVGKIGERQALANAFSKALRVGRIGDPPEDDEEKTAGKQGYLPKPDGTWSGQAGTTPVGAAVKVSLPSAAAPSSADDAVDEDSTGFPASAGHLIGFAYQQPNALGDPPAASLAAAPADLPIFRPKEEQSTRICGPDSDLSIANGLLALQPEATRACVITHPHPGRGGDMYNAFVSHAVQNFRMAGISTLRFNFSSPDGVGDDAEELLRQNTLELESALHTLSVRAPDAVPFVVGYSWGAIVALSAARKDPASVRAIALISPPISIDTMSDALKPGRRDFAQWPMLLLSGDSDEYCAERKLRTTAGDSACTVVIMKGVGHFLQGGHADAAARHAVQWAQGLRL